MKKFTLDRDQLHKLFRKKGYVTNDQAYDYVDAIMHLVANLQSDKKKKKGCRG